MLTDWNLTDMESCYKLFKRDIFRRIDIEDEENRFGFGPEIIAKVSGLPARVYEVPIPCYGRACAEGKKSAGRTALAPGVAS